MTVNSASVLGGLISLALVGTVQADDDAFKHVNLGFGADQGDLSITGSFGRFNGFASNQGMALDYLLIKQPIKKAWPVNVFIGGGAYISRHNDVALRLPMGVEFSFAKHWNIYAQLIPNWQATRPQGPDLAIGYGLRFHF